MIDGAAIVIGLLSITMIVLFVISFIFMITGQFKKGLALMLIAFAIDGAFGICSYKYVIDQGRNSPCNYVTPLIACTDSNSPFEQYNHIHPIIWIANIEYYYGSLISGSNHSDKTLK